MRGDGTSILENIEGAGLIGFHLLAPFMRGWRSRWGATPAELERKLPGDEYVEHPKWECTHAITIFAPAKEVWGWLVQIGVGRAGLYSYEKLENLAGCQIHNANQIIAKYQRLKAGDEIKIHPKAPGMQVTAVEPRQYILVHNDNRQAGNPSYLHTTWIWHLDAIDANTTRLISRSRNDYSPELANRLWMGPLFVEPVSFVMERKMLLGIKDRAERHMLQQPAWAN